MSQVGTFDMGRRAKFRNSAATQLLQPERVRSILTTLKAEQDKTQASADRRMLDLARQATDAEERPQAAIRD